MAATPNDIFAGVAAKLTTVRRRQLNFTNKAIKIKINPLRLKLRSPLLKMLNSMLHACLCVCVCVCGFVGVDGWVYVRCARVAVRV